MTDSKASLGTKPRLEFHPPDCLIVDERYQRSIARGAGKKLIAKIVEGFYWPFFGVLVATDNGDGTYCLIDGQHRAEAARQHPDIRSVPVMVIDEMTLAEQARAFVVINESRVKLNALQIHRAAVRAGDPEAAQIDAIARQCGISIPSNNISSINIQPGQTLSVKALYEILRSAGPEGLRNALNAVMAAYKETTGDLRSQIFKGVADALRRCPGKVTEIGAALMDLDAVSWEQEARSRSKMEGMSTVSSLGLILSEKINRHPVAAE